MIFLFHMWDMLVRRRVSSHSICNCLVETLQPTGLWKHKKSTRAMTTVCWKNHKEITYKTIKDTKRKQHLASECLKLLELSMRDDWQSTMWWSCLNLQKGHGLKHHVMVCIQDTLLSEICWWMQRKPQCQHQKEWKKAIFHDDMLTTRCCHLAKRWIWENKKSIPHTFQRFLGILIVHFPKLFVENKQCQCISNSSIQKLGTRNHRNQSFRLVVGTNIAPYGNWTHDPKFVSLPTEKNIQKVEKFMRWKTSHCMGHPLKQQDVCGC